MYHSGQSGERHAEAARPPRRETARVVGVIVIVIVIVIAIAIVRVIVIVIIIVIMIMIVISVTFGLLSQSRS